jgi:protein involved in polysaccharide export with SLBB domain
MMLVMNLLLLVYGRAQTVENPSVLMPTNANLANAVPIRKDPGLSLNLMAILDDRQKLGSGDRVTYRVIEDQDPPRPLMVGDSGDLDIPYLGLVEANGKTCKTLAHEIKTALEKDLYFQATVILSLELVNKGRTLGKVYVAGCVRVPGAQELPAGEVYTVSRAILKAGGFSDFANQDKVRILRMSKSEDKTNKKPIEVSLADIWKKGRRENDLALEPEDLVYVPMRMFNW